MRERSNEAREVFKKNLNYYMKKRGLEQADIVTELGITASTVSDWVNGKKYPRVDAMQRLADFLGVRMSQLQEDGEVENAFPPNILPVHRRKIPIRGNVAAGEPIFADEEHEEYVIEDDANDCDFALRIAGDSMEPLLHDGDIVYVRQQDDVNDGEIGILLLDDEAVIKHIYHIPDGVQVVSQNAAKYPPKTYTWPNYDTIRILGRAIAYRRNL